MNEAIKEPKLPLNIALQLYWRHLIGVAVFPTFCFLGIQYLHIPFVVFVPFFFAVCLHAAWPHFAKRAPYSFWLVACGVWMGGGLFAALLLGLISAIQLLLTTHQS